MQPIALDFVSFFYSQELPMNEGVMEWIDIGCQSILVPSKEERNLAKN